MSMREKKSGFKGFWLFLPVWLILAVLPVSAQEEKLAFYEPSGDLQEGQFAEGTGGERTGRYWDQVTTELAGRYEEAVLCRDSRVDVSDLMISYETFNEMVSQVRNSFPALFYAVPKRYSYSQETGFVYYFTIEYTAGEQEIAAYEAAVAQALAQIDSDMTDEYKALILHDYIALNCVYDIENLEADTLPDTVYQSYGALVKGSAVCQGIALAYQDLLDRAGIPCITVGSDPMNHAWNLIALDENYYHVDITWDDPVWDTLGQVFHEYFLLSDKTIGSGDNPHYDWSPSVHAESTRYENGFWKDSISGIFEKNGYVYYINGNGEIRKREMEGGQEAVLASVQASWSAGGNRSFARLALVNDCLYYNTPTEICFLGLNGGTPGILERPDTAGKQIYGLALEGEELRYHIRTSPGEKGWGNTGAAGNFSFSISGIYLGQTDMELKEGETGYLYAITLPNRRLARNPEWTSSDSHTASVDSQGMVRGIAGGSADIRVKAGDALASCSVKVNHLSEGALVEREANCTQPGSMVMKCTGCGQIISRRPIPVNGQHRYGAWITKEAATIFARGTQIRTCTLCKKTETRSVAKKKARVTLSAKSAPLQVKTSTKAICVVSCSRGDRAVSWKSSNPKVAAVNKKTGKITGKRPGKAAITVTMKSGAKARCVVKVQKEPVRTSKIKLDCRRAVLKKGEKRTLLAKRVPVTAKEKLTFRSMAPGVASVSKKGVVKGKKKGTALITVRTSNGKKAVCRITVK